MSLASLLEVVLPPSCAACSRYGTVLCGGCEKDLRPASDPTVSFLAADAASLGGSEVELVVSAFRHEGVARRCLQRLKYGGARRLANPLARAALPAFDDLLAVSGPAILVPVPVHVSRARERGYNQALLLAGALGAARQLPVVELLTRPRATQRQHALDRTARLANLRSAFAASARRAQPGRVIVVDDILTSGATMEACASVLHEAGVRLVYGFAIAREV